MDKDEILKRGRQEGPDERERKILCDAYSFAGTVGCVICIVFIVVSLIADRNPYPYCLIAMAYCAAMSLYKYSKLRIRRDLVRNGCSCGGCLLDCFVCCELLTGGSYL